ncbi:MAG: hypothetical protein H6571_03135 [Lewinellaceae bacterium]|nr:hypothetical protein [Lewinellaceae bacterium]
MPIFRTLTFAVGAICLLLFLPSCKEDKLGDPIIISNIKKEFYLDLSESLSPTQRFTHFNIRTIENGECLNGTIDFDFTRTGNRLTVSVNNVVDPEDCIPGIAPSLADVVAGPLQSGFYLFNFNLRDAVKNEGSLVVEDHRFLLNLETQEGVILLHKEIFRVPEHTVWGYLTYNEADLEQHAMSLMEQLNSMGTASDLAKGFYGYFTINSTEEGIEITDIAESTFLKQFVFDYEGDWDDLTGAADQFMADYPGISLKLFDDKGRQY